MKNKIDVLLFVKVPPPITGATLINKQVVDSSLIKDSFNIRVIGISYMNKLSDMGVFKFSKIKVFLFIVKTLISELVSHKPKVVYFQPSLNGIAFFRDLIFITIIKLFSVKILYHLHAKGIRNKNIYTKKLFKYAFNNEEIICLSSLLIDDVKDVYSKEPFIIANGISDSWTEKKQDFKSNVPIKIIFLSNLMKAKGLIEFIKVLKTLKDNKIKFEAEIIGDEHDISKEDLLKIVAQYNVEENVNYLGAIYGADKFSILSKSDILIYPTHNDCFPRVILEAFMCNTCVIATEEGAIPEIIDHRENGYLVDKKSIDQIVELVMFLNENREILRNISAEARNKYERHYKKEVFEENIKSVFGEVLN